MTTTRLFSALWWNLWAKFAHTCRNPHRSSFEGVLWHWGWGFPRLWWVSSLGALGTDIVDGVLWTVDWNSSEVIGTHRTTTMERFVNLVKDPMVCSNFLDAKDMNLSPPMWAMPNASLWLDCHLEPHSVSLVHSECEEEESSYGGGRQGWALGHPFSDMDLSEVEADNSPQIHINVFSGVTQVWAVFKSKSKGILPLDLTPTPLCYMHYFQPLPLSAGQESIRLHQVKCMHFSIAPPTGIIPLMYVVQLLDLTHVWDTPFFDIPPVAKCQGQLCTLLSEYLFWQRYFPHFAPLTIVVYHMWLSIENNVMFFLSASSDHQGLTINNLTCHIVTDTY